MATELPQDEERRFNGSVRLAREEDVLALRPILETWIKDRDTGEVVEEEINGVLEAVRGSARGEGETTLYVAQTPQGEVIGMMGFRPPEEKMMPFATTSKPAELINAYVSKDHRGGRGVGHSLVRAVREGARAKGYTEIILNSGPRYKFSGWPFWRRTFGEPVDKAIEFYGKDGDAPIWRETPIKEG